MKTSASSGGDAGPVRRGQAGERAFTLVELMIVVAMVAIFMSVGLPSIYNILHRKPMQKAVNQLKEAFQTARMRAILRGGTTEVVLTPGERSIVVLDVQDVQEPESDPGAGEWGRGGAMMEVAQPVAEKPASTNLPGFTAQWPESVGFKKLLVNLRDHLDLEEARIRFYPIGTSDAFSAVLFSEDNEEQSITLELTTGRETVEVIR